MQVVHTSVGSVSVFEVGIGFLVFLQRDAMIASAVLAIAIPSVCLYVCLSHAAIVSKPLHVAQCSLHCQIAKCV